MTDPQARRRRQTSAPNQLAGQRIPWVINRLYPLIATVLLVIVGMATTTWGAHLFNAPAWSLPHDLWRTLVAADRLRHLNFAGLYTPPTALVTFPGAAVILMPAVAVIDAIGLGLGFQTLQNPYPAAWLVAGPYEMALSGTALFAADAIAQHLGADRRGRILLAGAGALALWNVSARWGHPEDAVAVALLLYGALSLSRSRFNRSAYLIGAAVAVQPLVLLGLPVILAVLMPRQWLGFVVRAALPATALLGAAALANWGPTVRAVVSQPNFPSRNHPTPWTALAPDMGGGAVAAGPGRLFAVLCAGGCGLLLMRAMRTARRAGSAGVVAPADAVKNERWAAGRAMTPPALEDLLWWVAVALAMRCVFESVMVAYYLWPVLAVTLPAASRSRPRLVATSIAAVAVTGLSQAEWRGPWIWWGVVVLGLAVTLVVARRWTADEKPSLYRAD